MKLKHKKVKDKIMEIGYKTQCGHIASAMSCANILVDIYNGFPNEIIILSKGHGALAQYVILNMLGKISDDELDTYYKNGGLPMHATLDPEKGIFASTGSLGHGVGIGIGYAIANPKKKIIVVISDGELDEGSTLEGLRIIKKLGLGNILVVVDRNDLQAFSRHEPMNFFVPREYFSTKGEGFGEGIEDELCSHYTKITDEVYKEWKKNSSKIESHRRKLVNEYKAKNN